MKAKHSTVTRPDPATAFREMALEISDCWNQTGVEGDRSCPELDKLVHCRNCPVYTEVGLQLLNRGLPADYRREWVEHLARKRKPTVGNKSSVLVFRLGAEWLALPSQVFQEVAEYRPIHSIPHRRPGVVLGLVNVRGELLLCVSAAYLLGLEEEAESERPHPPRARLLVARWDGHRLAFPVGEVHGVHRFQPEELADPPVTLARAALTFTRGVFPWGEHTVGLLQPERLFSSLDRSLL